MDCGVLFCCLSIPFLHMGILYETTHPTTSSYLQWYIM
ncbi:hypothetical protein M086_2421, partial [Bacteroides fragilis str. S13 L11]